MRKCSFSGTNFDMITELLKKDASVWRTQLVCVCSLMSDKQNGVGVK